MRGCNINDKLDKYINNIDLRFLIFILILN